ncbi:hypothetical protein ABZ614_40005 [Streptomyces sp. NPDC013178]|uniref:hypothetical protein n=1 Tax=Streptomyces sp. NPDC013178 TaxID=3155118 RepID=UPI0033C44ED5
MSEQITFGQYVEFLDYVLSENEHAASWEMSADTPLPVALAEDKTVVLGEHFTGSSFAQYVGFVKERLAKNRHAVDWAVPADIPIPKFAPYNETVSLGEPSRGFSFFPRRPN